MSIASSASSSHSRMHRSLPARSLFRIADRRNVGAVFDTSLRQTHAGHVSRAGSSERRSARELVEQAGRRFVLCCICCCFEIVNRFDAERFGVERRLHRRTNHDGFVVAFAVASGPLAIVAVPNPPSSPTSATTRDDACRMQLSLDPPIFSARFRASFNQPLRFAPDGAANP